MGRGEEQGRREGWARRWFFLERASVGFRIAARMASKKKDVATLASGNAAKMVGGRGMGVATRRAGFWRRHSWLTWLAGALLLVLIALGVAISVALHRAEPMLRAAIVEKLEERFHARVELDSFHVSLVEGLTAEGKGLRIWPPAQVVGVTVPGANGVTAANSPAPLIQLDEFRFHAPLRYKPGKPIRISVVELKGLDVDVPPKTHFTHAADGRRVEQRV